MDYPRLSFLFFIMKYLLDTCFLYGSIISLKRAFVKKNLQKNLLTEALIFDNLSLFTANLRHNETMVLSSFDI